MDVNNVYTNIDHEEGADACYKNGSTQKWNCSIKHFDKLHSINFEI